MSEAVSEPTTEKESEFHSGITTVIAATGAEQETQIEVLGALKEFTDQIGDWETKAKSIKVTSVEQVEDMKLAKESRLGIRSIRLEMTNKLRDLKSDALKRCQGIDAVTRFVKEQLEPLEKALKHEEEFKKRFEAEERVKRIQFRTAQLAALGAQTKHLNLGDMGEDDYQVVLQEARDAKAAREQREREEKEEAERKAKAEAEERERVRKENERLQEEKAEREARHQMVLDRQRSMSAVEGVADYDTLSAMSDEDYTVALEEATDAHQARQEEAAKQEEAKKKAHRKVLMRQEAMQNAGSPMSYDVLKEMSDDDYKAVLKESLEAKKKRDEEAEAAAEEKRRAQAEAEELRQKQAKAEAEEKERLQREAEEKERIESAKVSSAAINAADILLETAETWAKRNPDIDGGKGLFIAAAIEHLRK